MGWVQTRAVCFSVTSAGDASAKRLTCRNGLNAHIQVPTTPSVHNPPSTAAGTAPNSDALVATLQALVQGALQQTLGTRIRVDDVTAQSMDATLTVAVRYTVLRTQSTRTASFVREVPA